MQIVTRNFINLLSAGAFNNNVEIEEMSEYKWNQLLYLSKINNVDDIITSGIIFLENNSNIILPSKISELINKKILNKESHFSAIEYSYKKSENRIKKIYKFISK